MKQYMLGIAKGVLGIVVLLIWGQERMGITMASSVSGNAIDVSGNNVPDAVAVYETSVADNEIVQLQVPENIDFVIDPWGVAGQGQVYSERYVIRNCGTKEGLLYLSDIVCCPGEGSDVVIVPDEKLILADEEKTIYIEMHFDNGEVLILSQEENQYCIEIAPGNEMVFWITGSINSKMAHKWENNDVMLNMKYSFEASAH